MKLTEANSPGREIVLAYTLTFGAEGSALVLADLQKLVDEMFDRKTDNTGRIDPLKLAAADAMRVMLKWIHDMRTMDKNPEWQAIETRRQMDQAQQKEDQR